MSDEARYLRQILLSEIGREGQKRISRGRARVGGNGLCYEIAEQYARGAGFGSIEEGEIIMDELAPNTIIASPVCAQVCAGARAALRAMREAIFNQEPGGSH